MTNPVPDFHAHIDSPYKYIKHIQRFETNIFPDCYTITKEWQIGKTFHKKKIFMAIHHAPTCVYEGVVAREGTEQLSFDKFPF
jgi:hypothetical protein